MMSQKDEQADRERSPNDISLELKQKVEKSVRLISQEIKARLATRNSPLLVAIDGGSASGKSTITILVAAEVGGVIIQGDDFCQTGLDWANMSITDKIDLCIDWERARTEAIEPLLANRTASWHPFNFKTGIGLADYLVVRNPMPVIIIDGIYSSNPKLSDILALTVLVDASASIRYHRHNEREGHDDTKWHAIWDEAELFYFTQIRPPASFDIVIETS